MAQILPRPLTFGEQFGTGLSSGLDLLMQQQAQQEALNQQAQRASQGLEAMGYAPAQAAQLSQLPPTLLQPLIKEKMQAERFAPLMSQLQSLYGFGQPTAPAQAQPIVGEIPPGQLPMATQPAMMPTQETAAAPQPTMQLDQAEQAQLMSALTTGDPRQIQQTIRDISKTRQREEQFGKRMAFEEKKEAAREKREMTKEERIEQHAVQKETLPYYTKVNKEYKAAKDNNMRLARMEKLNEEGNLGIPVLNTLINTISKGIFGAGIDLKFLMTADAQEMDKLSADFLKNIQDVLGSKVTEVGINNYLKTVPTLAQSKDGRTRLINNLRQFNDVIILRDQVMNDLIEKNNGLRPRNLEGKVEKLIEPQLDEIAKIFTEQPRAQTPRPTLLGSEALGNVAQILGLKY